MQLSEYLHDPTEYGLHINTHVSLWLHSRSYDNKPLLVQAFGFVIVTEEIPKAATCSVVHYCGTGICT